MFRNVSDLNHILSNWTMLTNLLSKKPKNNNDPRDFTNIIVDDLIIFSWMYLLSQVLSIMLLEICHLWLVWVASGFLWNDLIHIKR